MCCFLSHSSFTRVHVKISSSTKDLSWRLDSCVSAALTHPQQQNWEWGFHAKPPVWLKGLHLHNNNNTHKRNMFQYNLTVPPGGQTVLFPQSHGMFFLESPFIWVSIPCDNLEMSSKSNIFIYAAEWCIYWKGCNKIRTSCKSREEKGMNVQVVYSGIFARVHCHKGRV